MKACEDGGFTVEKLLKFNRIGAPGWWLNGRVLKKDTFGLWQIKFLNFLIPFVQPIDRFLPFPHLSWIAILHANPQAAGQLRPDATLAHPVPCRRRAADFPRLASFLLVIRCFSTALNVRLAFSESYRATS